MALLKKLTMITFLIFLISKVTQAAGEIDVNNFSAGLDTLDNPAEIDPSASQDLLNVNLQPGGGAVFKREGYGLFQTLPVSCSTCAVHGGYHFQQVGGNDVQLWGNDTELAASVNDATFVRVATSAVAATWQCADSQGFAYCVNSSRDTSIKTDGSVANTSFQPAIPSGTMVAMTPLQLVVAGVVGNENTLYVSAATNFLNFVIGILPSSPFTEPIASPGSRITHIAYYFGKLFWWKDQSFGYATFTNQNDWQLTIVSNQIGTLDNSDAFWNSSGFDSGTKFSGTAQANAEKSPGGIFFRGQDNHIYVYDGYYLTRLSRPITPTVTAANRQKANSWKQSSALDFSAGSYDRTNYSTANVGVWISTNDVNTPDNSFESNLWSVVASTSISFLGQQTAFSSPDCGTINAKDGARFVELYNNNSGRFLQATLNVIDAVTGSVLGATTTVSGNITSCGYTSSSVGGALLVTNLTGLSSYAKQYAQIKISNNIDAGTLTSPAFALSGNDITFYFGANKHLAQAYVWLDFFQAGQSTQTTGVYYSAVNNDPSLTSWGTFNATTGGTGGAHTFLVRSSTGSFTVLSSTPAWVAQPNNAAVAASTGTYMQMADTFTVTVASQTPTLNSFVFNWYEGTASDKAYMAYFNDAIWFSVSASSSTSLNNRVFYWDILNGAWLLYDIPANGFQIENNSLYFGSTTGPYVYKFGGVPTDNGQSISSYWRSKSFLGKDLFVQNEFVQADFIMAESPGNLTYTYTLDSSTSTAYVMTAFDSRASLIQRNFLLPVGKIGKYYDFKVGDNSSSTAWKMMGHRVMYNPLNWKVTLQ